jgi:chromosomal replication initiation ATPase DnaA
MGIISSVTGADIMENSRRRPVVDARQLFYKIYREVGVYSFSDIGAFFGKNHATVRLVYFPRQAHKNDI